jgi:hypothetical protein
VCLPPSFPWAVLPPAPRYAATNLRPTKLVCSVPASAGRLALLVTILGLGLDVEIHPSIHPSLVPILSDTGSDSLQSLDFVHFLQDYKLSKQLVTDIPSTFNQKPLRAAK